MATVLIIGDTHAPAMRKGYVDFLKSVADRYGPNRIVHVGDLADWHSLSYHERSPALHNPVDERKRALRQVASLVAAFPKADWLIGNHDALTHRQAQTAGLPEDILKSYNDMWEVPWRVHERFSELVIDGVIYAHGEGPGGMYAHGNRAKLRFRSYVMGHLHANAGVIWHANPEFRVFGMAVGCGIDHEALQFAYGMPIARKPILGCGVVEDGKRAYFEPWLLKSR